MDSSNPDKYQVTQEKINIGQLKKLKQDTFLFKLKTHFRSYCNHTGIHGFQYFGQKRTAVEICWWIIVFIGIICGCGFTIYLIYNKWQRSPVIVSLTTKDTPIYQVPFPAVTICPTIKFSKECINFSDILNRAMLEDDDTDVSPEQQKMFSYMLPICKTGLLIDEDGLEELELPSSSNGTTISDDVFETFKNGDSSDTIGDIPNFLFCRTSTLTIECSPFLGFQGLGNSAKFMGDEINFEENFHPHLTDDGLCLTFNMLSTKDIFRDEVYFHPGFNSSGPESHYIPQEGYLDDAELDTYPRRALMSGAVNSLEIKLFHEKKDIDFKCTGAEQGYKVILHHPTRVPRPALEYTMVQFSKASTISVKPSMMTTSDVVKTYPPDKRDCYFDDEKELQFFKIYSQKNCLFECVTNYTLKKCGCVAFYMPRQASTPICGIAKLHCVNSARKKYNLTKLKSKLHDYRKTHASKKTKKNQVLTNSPVLNKNTTSSETSPDVADIETALEELLKVLDNETSSTVPVEETEATIETSRKKRNIIKEPAEDERSDSAVCNCYRTCNDLTYIGTATAMEYDWREESILGMFMNSTEYDYTLITIFLDTDTIFTTERNELYGPTDFLSNFGGLIALFTGFSILSLMEILYFCSLRIFGNQKILGKWYGDKEE